MAQLIIIILLLLCLVWKDNRFDWDKLSAKLDKKGEKKVSMTDIHENGIDDSMRHSLTHELRMHEQKPEIKTHTGVTDAVRLGDFLRTMLDCHGFTPYHATAYGTEREEIEGAAAVDAYPLLSAIVKEGRFTADKALLTVDFMRYEGEGDEERFVATLTLEARSEDEATLRVQATVSRAPMERVRWFDAAPMVRSVMLAYDKLDTRQRLAQFDYLLKEALAADVDELEGVSAKELELISQTSMSWSRNVFFGHKYFNEGRYYDAIMCFEAVFDQLAGNYFRLSNYWSLQFFEICHLLGRSYNCLGLHKMAIYYLEIILPTNRIASSMEYVNALIELGDVRTVTYINNVVGQLEKHIAEETANGNEVPENILEFYHFLRRRKGFTMINFGDLDGAEALFTELSKEPANHEYAERELEYIRELRKKG